jgi:hypothetical protein
LFYIMNPSACGSRTANDSTSVCSCDASVRPGEKEHHKLTSICSCFSNSALPQVSYRNMFSTSLCYCELILIFSKIQQRVLIALDYFQSFEVLNVYTPYHVRSAVVEPVRNSDTVKVESLLFFYCSILLINYVVNCGNRILPNQFFSRNWDLNSVLLAPYHDV